MDAECADRLESLQQVLRRMDGVVVAYSGGVDSTLLLSVAAEVLGARVLAVTACSETYSDEELQAARLMAVQLGVRHAVLQTSELQIPQFAENPVNRCYYCKRELYSRLAAIATEEGLHVIVDGAQADDVGDHRPGHRAAAELGVRSPLLEVGLTKPQIRELSRERGLPTWNRPAMACLASRFPYGQRITGEGLQQVAAAEQFLHDEGFAEVRVRHHGAVARIEAAPELLGRLAAEPLRGRLVAALKAAGFTYISLDLEGYRQGSMNEVVGAGPDSAPREEAPDDN